MESLARNGWLISQALALWNSRTNKKTEALGPQSMPQLSMKEFLHLFNSKAKPYRVDESFIFGKICAIRRHGCWSEDSDALFIL